MRTVRGAVAPVAVAGMLLVLGACADGAGPGTRPSPTSGGSAAAPSTGTAAPSRPPSTGPTGRPGGAARPAPAVLTEADDGAVLELPVGQEVALRLSSQWSWTSPQVDGGDLDVVPVDHLVDPGYQEWSLSASTPGRVVLRADGTPACGDDAACPARALTLTLAVLG